MQSAIEIIPSFVEGQDARSGCSRSFLTQLEDLRDAVKAGNLKKRLISESEDERSVSASSTINEILDTIIGTYERAVTSVDGMAVGNIPEPFEGGFPGDFARAMHVCNDFIDVINRRNTQIAKMTEAAAHGDLHVRAHVEEFTGVNRRIFEGFNEMFEAWLAPVVEIEQVLSALTKMDLTARVKGHYTGEYGRIGEALNTVCLNLAHEVEQISQHTLVMASASEELTATTRDLANGAAVTSHLATSAAQSSEHVSAGLTRAAAGSSAPADLTP